MSFAEHRNRVMGAFPDDIIVLKGGEQTTRYNTDRDIMFRQESNFLYLTGCNEPDCIAFIDSRYNVFMLFVPRYSPEHALWLGEPESNDLKQVKYGASNVMYIDELPAIIEQTVGRNIHIIDGLPNIEFPEGALVLKDLGPAIAEARVYKTDWEIEQMTKAAQAGADAQKAVMRLLTDKMHEFHAEALYVGYVMARGCRHTSFDCITAGGQHASILHYVDNVYKLNAGDTFLLDSGCEVNGYASDHTRTFPVSQRFTQRQEALYNVVLRANKECIDMCQPGTPWEDVHMHALSVILQGLRECGIVRSEGSFTDQMEAGVPTIFMPHGLGHLIGLDVHDVGGYRDDIPRSTDPRLCRLRTRRTLAPQMVITIEPGIYFIPGFLARAYDDPVIAPHINFEVVEEYRAECGGYRIEDDVLVTAGGPVTLPGAPKELSEIYALRDQAYQ